MKYVIIDNRMRKPEKDFLKNLGYELIELPKSAEVYPEISAHVDIFVCKIDDEVIVEKSQYNYIKSQAVDAKIIERKQFCWRKISRRYKIQCLPNWK